jgi:predicted MFS family arabinose efflux permease
MSSGIWLVAVPLLLYGLVSPAMAYGRRPAKVPAEIEAPESARDGTFRKIMAEPRFWAVGAALFLVSLVDQAFTQHQVLIYDDAGIDRRWTAIGVSAIGVFGIITRLIVGNILDATSSRGLAILWWVLSISILMAFWIASPLIFMAYIVFRAAGHSAVLLDALTLTKHVWGPSKSLGMMLGAYGAMSSAGFALGPWLMGRMHDMSGSYGSAFMLFATIPVIASLLIWWVEPVFWKQLKAEAAGKKLSQATAKFEATPPLAKA